MQPAPGGLYRAALCFGWSWFREQVIGYGERTMDEIVEAK